MISSLCYKHLYLKGINASPIAGSWMPGDCLWNPIDKAPLVSPPEVTHTRRKQIDKRRHRKSLQLAFSPSRDQLHEACGKSLPLPISNEASTGVALVSHLQHLIGGSRFTFRRFQKDEMEVRNEYDENDDARTVVTYISLNNVCLKEEHDGGLPGSILMSRSAVDCLKRPEKSRERRQRMQKQHVSWKDLQNTTGVSNYAELSNKSASWIQSLIIP